MLSKLVCAAMLLAPLTLAAPALPAADDIHAIEINEYHARDMDSIHEEIKADNVLEPRYEVICRKGVRVFSARGSGAPLRDGAFSAIGDGVAALEPGSFSGSIPYPATTDMSKAMWSVDTGIEMLTNRVQRYIDACPTGPVVLLGYSQGAWVVGNTLIGPSGTTGQGLAQKYRDRSEYLRPPSPHSH